MDEHRVAGTAKEVGGKVEEGLGRAAGSARLAGRGAADQALGQAEDLYGQASDAARETAATFDTWFRDKIETQPYTTALIALGVGWLVGRTHRPY
jgi:uncharacterized protein YjbJ (UPF0337 family)